MMSAGASAVSSLGIQVGDVIGDKYRIDAVLGAGGMGVVFAARHTTLHGQFALKFLSREGLANSQSIGRFYREAQAAAKLRSEHAVRVFDVGTHTNGLPYIVMEYLEGGDLGRLLRNGGQLPVSEAVDYLQQTCAAIADAHKAGIIHRDIKPSNLFCVTRDDNSLLIKVLDFGISKVTDALPSEEGVTVTGNFIGSPSYMSPEQMKAPNRVDFRTDIWSLGVVLYECLTAKLPFPASTFPEICLRVAQDPPVPPRKYRPDLPERLEAIILKCLEKDREKRFPSAQALADALSEFGEPKPGRATESSQQRATRVQALGQFSRAPSARTASFSLTQPSWVRTASGVASRRRPLLLGIAASALAVLIAVVGGLIWYDHGKLSAEVSSAVPSQAPSSSKAAAPTPQAPTDVAPPAPKALERVTPPAPLAPAAPAPPVAVTPPQSPASFAAAPATKPAPPSVARPIATQPKRSAPTDAPATAVAPTTKPKPATERDAKSSVWKR